MEVLSRLAALEATLLRQSTARGLAEAPAPLVRLVADLLAETRALLPGRARKAALPRLHPNHSNVSHAELSVIAGQARVVLAAFIAAKGLDKPAAAPDPTVEAMRAKLAKHISNRIREGVEKRLAEVEAARAETAD